MVSIERVVGVYGEHRESGGGIWWNGSVVDYQEAKMVVETMPMEIGEKVIGIVTKVVVVR